jgi:Holliday junction resolvase-like predicted endonuclease
MDIIKASGEKETFSHEKFCQSVKLAGAPAGVVTKVCALVEKEIKPNDTTAQIEKKTLQYLKRESLLLTAKYKLKGAIMELGPAGFFFEEYMAAVLREYGYKTKVGSMMRGKCLSHEIDILAEKESIHNIIELKYHNRRGLKTDVQVAMYTYARFLDIAAAHKRFEARLPARQEKKHKAWVITNTKFTRNAITYANCMGMNLIAWRYPKKQSLAQLIEEKSLYPITVLPSATRAIKEQFAQQKLMFVRDLLSYSESDLQKKFGLKSFVAKRLLKEAYDLV